MANGIGDTTGEAFGEDDEEENQRTMRGAQILRNLSETIILFLEESRN